MSLNKRLAAVIGNTSLMMLIALLLALAFGGFSDRLPVSSGTISMLALIFMMTLALSTIDLRDIKIAPYRADALHAFVLSFIVSTGLTLCISMLFEGDVRSGWIVEAAVPSAVSVISFTYLWGGNTESSIVSSIIIYLSALVVTPFIALIFMGKEISELTLLYYVGVLIIIPICLSPFVRRLNIPNRVRTASINIAFFVMVVAIAGQSRGVFFSSGSLILMLVLFAVIRVFGLGIMYYWIERGKGAIKRTTVNGSLFVTYKNTGMAAALALLLIGPDAAAPAAVCIVVEIFWLIFAGRYLFGEKAVEKVASD